MMETHLWAWIGEICTAFALMSIANLDNLVAQLGLSLSPRLRDRWSYKPVIKRRTVQESDVSDYLSEIRTHWRPILAAVIGMGSGMSVVGVITSTIIPTLLADVGWSHADFAKVGSYAMFMAVVFPFIGRLTDQLGVRWTALIGQVTLPLCYLAYSRMDGNISSYIAIFVVQSLLCVTTTATVYSRLAVQYVEKARGLALAIVVSGAAVSGPILNRYVEANGWRAAFVAIAIFTAIAGLITFLLIPADSRPTVSGAPKRKAREDYPLIFRSPAFWLLIGAMALCNLPQTLLQVQTKMLLLDNGISGQQAGAMLVAPQFGMLAGRFLTGLALDRFRPYFVAFITLALPSLGLFVMASSFDSPAVLMAAIFFIGFAFGAEGDVVAFLVARKFGVSIYSSVMGLMTAMISISTASGAFLLGKTMERNGGHFDLFLWIVGVAVLVGASLLLALGRIRGDESAA
jgi:predicted MFS family arabinose efflux permease